MKEYQLGGTSIVNRRNGIYIKTLIGPPVAKGYLKDLEAYG
jgi:hypothetical protein